MPQLTFFIGKGGVGKTTLSAAYAVRQAARYPRHKVLLLSTDPAHSLAPIFAVKMGNAAQRIRPPQGKLFAWQLDAERIFRRFLDDKRDALLKLVESGTLFSAKEIEPLLDSALPGMAELGGLLALKDLVNSEEWDEVVIDTAPIGHTLRLFALPEHFARFLRFLDLAGSRDRWLTQRFGRSAPSPADEVLDELTAAGDAMRAVLAGKSSRVFLVTSPEVFSLQQAARSVDALHQIAHELPLDSIIVNRALRKAGKCGRCSALAGRTAHALRFLERVFPDVPVSISEDPGRPILGVSALRQHAETVFGKRRYAKVAAKKARALALTPAEWPKLPQRISFTLGKGGVGKTTVSAALAFLARQRTKQPVIICSTDPAPSLDDIFQSEVTGELRPVLGDHHLQAVEVDSVAEFRQWADAMQQKIAGAFSQQRGGIQIDVSFDRQIFSALLDIVPPGVDEIFAIFKILDLTAAGGRRIVIDMAPTGHALELLRMPERIAHWSRLLLKTLAAHRTLALAQDVAVEIATIGQRVRALRSVMQDPRRSCAIAVLLPEPLPEQQTQYLLDQLSGLGIEVAAVMVNRVLLDVLGCSRCASIQTWQRKTLERLTKRPVLGKKSPRRKRNAPGLYLLPEQPDEVVGRKALERFTGQLYQLK